MSAVAWGTFLRPVEARAIGLKVSGGQTGGVVLNELLADNSSSFADEAGEYDDWIELFNPGDAPLGLTGLYLTDKRDRLDKWRITQTDLILAPGAFVIAWCDEQQEQGGLHANFKLSAGGEFLALVDRDGVTLVGLATMPWETVVVREDGFAQLGAGVSVVRQPDGEIALTNRTARDLRAVVVVMPSSGKSASRAVHFFPRIKDGESKKASEGKTLPFTPWATSSNRLTEYDLAPIKKDLESESRGLVAAWIALGEATGVYADWWPDDVPVILAQLDGGEGVALDGGLRVEQDRVLIRLVGYGGVP